MPTKTDEAPDIEPIVVLDLIMPNGKRMRDCTGAEMEQFRRQPSPKARRVFAEARANLQCPSRSTGIKTDYPLACSSSQNSAMMPCFSSLLDNRNKPNPGSGMSLQNTSGANRRFASVFVT